MDELREQPEITNGQSPLSQTLSNLATLFVVAIAVGGIWWWMVGTVQSPSRLPADTRQTITVLKPPRAAAPNGNGNGSSRPKEDSASIVDEPTTGPRFDASRTSWQNPFFASHWTSTGWTFSPQAMRSSGESTAVATFRRDYRKVTVECEIAPIGEPGEFHIVLFAAETDALMRAEFTPNSIKLTAKIKGIESVIKQRKLTVPFVAKTPTTLRLTATGNRALVICNGKVVFNGSQPAQQSGKPLKLSLRSVRGAFRITDLRLEGE